MESNIEKLIRLIRATPIARQLIPMEAASGWPIPLRRKGGEVYVRLPFFGSTRTAEKGKTPLFPPFATLTVDWSNGLPVEYINLRFRNPWPEGQWEEQVGTFPHPSVAQITVDQYKEKRRELLAMYDQMFDILAQDGTFSSEWSVRFGHLLRTLMEPSLEPYYRALGPKFFDRFLPVKK